MTRARPPGADDPNGELSRALPGARKLARTTARIYRVGSPDDVAECEQIACQALVEACSGFDASRGVPLLVFAWKRIVGAVTDWIHRESRRRAGLDAALALADALPAEGDPFEEDQGAAVDRLKGYCRALALARFLGDRRALIEARPHDALVRAETLEVLAVALRGLNERERRLIELRYWDDLSWAKVGDALGVHEKLAQRLDERLRERLRRDLRDQGVGEALSSELE